MHPTKEEPEPPEPFFRNRNRNRAFLFKLLVAHDCGYPLSRYTCRATRVAADFLDFIALCRFFSSGVAPHLLEILVSHLPPPFPGGVATKFGSEKVSRYTGVSQGQLRVSRYTVQLSVKTLLKYGEALSPKGCRNRKLEPLEPVHARTVTEPNRGHAADFDWKKGKGPPPPRQDSAYLDFTKDPRPLYYKTPPCAFYHKNVRSKAVFGP